MLQNSFLKISVLVFGCFLFVNILLAQQLAFPTAEGGGKYSKGGRGGAVIEVTNLNDNGAGSLRAAILVSGARTVVFRVSGTIILNSALKISKDSITIAGQTAPGDGICLRKYPLVVSANHVIIRYLRLRLGNESGNADDGTSGFTNDYTAFMNHSNKHHIVLDHCSVSWSIDETLSYYGNDSVTVQWCLSSESLYDSRHPKGKHGYGGIWGGRFTSFHHNLLAHHDSRNPRFSGGLPTRSNGTVPSEYIDFRNNVIYNWGNNSTYGGESSTINMVANYYKPGVATKTRSRIAEPFGPDNGGVGASLGQWFISGNVMEGSEDITLDNWNGGVQGLYASDPAVRSLTEFPYVTVTTQTAMDAYTSVLSNVGARLPKQDSIDSRIIREVSTGTVTYGGKTYGRDNMSGDTLTAFGILDSQNDVGGWPVLNSIDPPIDTDHDGMPDEWENNNGLNPNNAPDRNIVRSDGYTQLEAYLNYLTGEMPTGVNESNINVPLQFVLMQNYPNPFNPSTTITYSVVGTQQNMSLRVYDIFGREVATLVAGKKFAGLYKAEFNGSKLASGVYFAHLQAGSYSQTIKLVLAK